MKKPNTRVMLLGGSIAAFHSFRMPLIDALIQQGREVHCAYWGTEKCSLLIENAKWYPLGSTAHHRGIVSNMLAIIKLAGLILRLQPEAVLFFNGKPILLGPRLFQIFSPRTKRIVLLEGLGKALKFVATLNRSLKSDLGRFLLKPVHHWVVLNSVNAQQIRSFLGTPERDFRFTRTFGIGVDLEKFSAVNPERLYENRTAVFVGRLVSEKGISTFIELAKNMTSECSDWKFAVACADAEDSDIPLEQLTKLVAEGVLTSAGAEADMPKFYQNASVLVFPSSYEEGFPATIMEAQARGLPCLVAKRDVLEDCIETGVSGFFCDINTLDEWKASLMSLEDNKKFLQMSKTSSKRANRLYDQNQFIDRLCELLN